jgi:hypothetical protein
MVMVTQADAQKPRKARWLRRPTAFATHGQSWSNRGTHLQGKIHRVDPKFAN